MTTTRNLEVIANPGEKTVTTKRWVSAPRALVWECYTKAEHMKRWLGPRNLTTTLFDIDLRVGGKYRFVQRAPDGNEFGFHGVYKELEKPSKIVWTFVFEAWPDAEAIDTVTFEEQDGGTLIMTHSLHESVENRDAMVKGGMEGGMKEGYERLDELLVELGGKNGQSAHA